jgi:hypothetical protein
LSLNLAQEKEKYGTKEKKEKIKETSVVELKMM